MDISTAYLVSKSVHIIGVISWMAGLLYFYRLFVYHFDHGQKNDSNHQLLSVMETRLFRLTLLAMSIAVTAGLLMIHLNPALMSNRWFQIKIVAAFFMITMTFHGITPMRLFKAKKFKGYSSVRLRLLNEVPAVLMIIIVIMVILRPF